MTRIAIICFALFFTSSAIYGNNNPFPLTGIVHKGETKNNQKTLSEILRPNDGEFKLYEGDLLHVSPDSLMEINQVGYRYLLHPDSIVKLGKQIVFDQTLYQKIFQGVSQFEVNQEDPLKLFISDYIFEVGNARFNIVIDYAGDSMLVVLEGEVQVISVNNLGITVRGGELLWLIKSNDFEKEPNRILTSTYPEILRPVSITADPISVKSVKQVTGNADKFKQNKLTKELLVEQENLEKEKQKKSLLLWEGMSVLYDNNNRFQLNSSIEHSIRRVK